ncbi:hypothetical protein FCV43_05980 [Vibrio genomosp. F6]|uniref:hypothetical protein n=1 Tax=Vibrio genomosp. F6 TaxID=723172 RepID=UPI0010BD7D60|nr:hypothetical protein [Vibrio genomosp. F6]TKF22562.1 hypothetical protein FCV43_05980 [Vibrio genomosp. F6]
MKKTLWLVLLITISLGLTVALTLPNINNKTNTACSSTEAIKEQLEQADDLVGLVKKLSAQCPKMTKEMAKLASLIQPTLMAEILKSVLEIVPNSDIAELTAMLVEIAPKNLQAELVQIAVEVNPALAQEIVDAVAKIGAMDPTDIILAAISGGADPASITEPTAAGTPTAGALVAADNLPVTNDNSILVNSPTADGTSETVNTPAANRPVLTTNTPAVASSPITINSPAADNTPIANNAPLSNTPVNNAPAISAPENGNIPIANLPVTDVPTTLPTPPVLTNPGNTSTIGTGSGSGGGTASTN